MIERTHLPGTLLKYRQLNNVGFFPLLSKPVEVCDFSKSGICFYGDGSIQDGDHVLMKVIFPDGKKLRLKGEIRWAKENTSLNHFRYGVQFFPFGYGGKYNRPEALNILREKTGQHLVKIERPREDDHEENLTN